MKEFKEFILRGNVIDLAVAVVIGAAFTAVVNAVVENVINPMIAALFDADKLTDAINWVLVDNPGVENDVIVRFGAVLGALIQFLIVAAFIFFALVIPMNRLRRRAEARRAAGEVDEEAAPTELELLADIRDLLSGEQPQSREGKHVTGD